MVGFATALAMVGAWLAWLGGALVFGDDADCTLDCVANLLGGVVMGGAGMGLLVGATVLGLTAAQRTAVLHQLGVTRL